MLVSVGNNRCLFSGSVTDLTTNADLRRLAAEYGLKLGPQPRLHPTGC
jgi:hypothetical protein